MIYIKNVFGDHALFQAGAELRVSGWCDTKKTVTMTLRRGGKKVLEASGDPDDDGRFSLAFTTPGASFDTYSMTYTSGSEEKTVSDILFGELWMGCGQSNMEMPSEFMDAWPQMEQKMKARRIRVFMQNYAYNFRPDGKKIEDLPRVHGLKEYGHDFPFGMNTWDLPYEPQEEMYGRWICTDGEGEEILKSASGLCVGAVLKIYDQLAADGKGIPVGFLNVSIGATNIQTWIPREYMVKDAEMTRLLKESAEMTNDEEAWNDEKSPQGPYNQPSALFNIKIAPVIGVTVAGLMWHQGEGNLGLRQNYAFYKRSLELLHASYKELFAKHSDFYMICSHLFPFCYGEGFTGLGRINQAVTDFSKEFEDFAAAAPVHDLKSCFAIGRNHPIHPAHKFELGERFGDLALAMRYGYPGAKNIARAVDFSFEGNRVLIRFDNHLGPLELRGRYGFKVAGENGIFVNGEPRIADANTLELSHPGIEKIASCAYMMNNMDLFPTLYADGMPVSPFTNDKDKDPVATRRVWMYPELDSLTVPIFEADPEKQSADYDYFKRPSWREGKDSEIARDPALARTACTLRIRGSEGSDACEAYVPAYPYERLDLENFDCLTFELIHAKDLNGEIVLQTEKGNEIKIAIEQEKIAFDRMSCRADLSQLSLAEGDAVKKMIFRFANADGAPICHAAMEKFVLYPKNAGKN